MSVDPKTNKLVDIPAPKEIWQWMKTAVQAIRELNKLDKSEADQNAQLIQWVSESPLDWQFGGPCKAFMFGRNKEGQLAEATSESKRKIPSFVYRAMTNAFLENYFAHFNVNIPRCVKIILNKIENLFDIAYKSYKG